jgi:hypothetical protein
MCRPAIAPSRCRRASTTLAACLAGLLTAATASLAADELLVSSNGPAGAAILRFDGTTGAPLGTLVEAGTSGLDLPFAMAVHPGGDLLVVDSNPGSVLRFDSDTGALVGEFVAQGVGGIEEPLDLAYGPDGEAYVANCGNHTILRYDGASGTFLGTFVPAGSGGLTCPSGLAFGPTGDLFVSSLDTQSVLRYDGTTGAFLGELVTGLTGPRHLRFGSDGNLYVAAGGGIARYRGSDGLFLGAFVPASAGMTDFTFGPDGNVYASTFVPGGDVDRFRGTDGAPLGVFVAAGSGGLEMPRALLFRGAPSDDPPPPGGPWLTSPELAGFRVKARIQNGGDLLAGTSVPDCIAETLCVAGALPDRAEVFVRVVGPKPNGHLWPTLVKFSTSRIEIWIEQLSTNIVRHYELEPVAPGQQLLDLDGLADKQGFSP